MMGRRMVLKKASFSDFHALLTELLRANKATQFCLTGHVLRVRTAVLWCPAIWKAGPSETGPAQTQERAAAKNNDLGRNLGQAGNHPHAWRKLEPELGNQASGPGRE